MPSSVSKFQRLWLPRTYSNCGVIREIACHEYRGLYMSQFIAPLLITTQIKMQKSRLKSEDFDFDDVHPSVPSPSQPRDIAGLRRLFFWWCFRFVLCLLWILRTLVQLLYFFLLWYNDQDLVSSSFFSDVQPCCSNPRARVKFQSSMIELDSGDGIQKLNQTSIPVKMIPISRRPVEFKVRGWSYAAQTYGRFKLRARAGT